MKIAIIGYGASSIGFLYKLLNSQLNNSAIKKLTIDIYDQNSQQTAGGLGGLAYDGKLNVGQYAGSDQLIDIQLQQQLLAFVVQNSKYDVQNNSLSQHMNNQRKKWFKQFYDNQLYLFQQQTTHLGTDQLRYTNDNIINKFKTEISDRELKITFNFNKKITPDNISIFQIKYDKIIFAVGRYGTTLLNYFKQKQQFVLMNNKVDIGVRFQLPSKLTSISQLDQLFYEWKIKYKTTNNMMVRTFCHNPGGYVVVQNVDVLNSKVAIANGHSKSISKSNNTNFAILVTQQFTQPFNDSVLYGKIIAQQANLLAGSQKKVILQTLGDFKKKKRTKKLFRVNSTLADDKYIYGDLTHVLPARVYQAIIQFIDKLSIVVPQISNYDNLLYGIQTKFYGMKMNNNQKFYWIGDCSGKSRSIIAAMSTGYLLAEQLIQEINKE